MNTDRWRVLLGVGMMCVTTDFLLVFLLMYVVGTLKTLHQSVRDAALQKEADQKNGEGPFHTKPQ